MKFFKSTSRTHPYHELPTVEWDPENNKSRFEFVRGESGLLEFNTNDPELIKELKERGYGYEIEEPDVPTVKKTMVLRDDEVPPKNAKAIPVSVPKVIPPPPQV